MFKFVRIDQLCQDVRRGTLQVLKAWLTANHFSMTKTIMDSLSSLGLDTQIYTVDIDPALVSEETKQKMPDSVKLIEGDYNKIAEVFPPTMLQSLPHPWLVIEDGHNFFETVMAYLNDYMITGDYLVVEDIDPRIPAQLGIYSMDEEIGTWGTEKLDTLKKFIKGTGRQFMVDSFFTDYYGY